MGKTSVVLIITATINPKPGTILAVRDPAIRLQEYCQALKYYLSLPSEFIDRILFLENSDSDLSSINRIAKIYGKGKKVEVISFPRGNDDIEKKGMVYNEFKLITFGLKSSTVLSENDIFWKVTGRLRLKNIVPLIETAPRDYCVYCDLFRVPFIKEERKLWKRVFHTYKWMDLRFFSFTIKGYAKYFRDAIETAKKVPSKQSMFDIFERDLPGGEIIPRFKLQPIVEGINAVNGTNYQNVEHRFKNGVRSCLRSVAPWIWI